MTVREFITKIGFKVNEKEYNEAEKKSLGLAKGMKIGFAAVIGAVVGIGAAALNAAGEMEMLQTQFEVMLGSSEAAAAMMKDLSKFAAATPFGMADLAKNSQQLLSFGVGADQVLETLRMLGDTAGGSSEKLGGLVLAYGKVTTKGKASMEELNMLAERGLPIFTVLADQLGVTREKMFDMVSKGQVSAEHIRKSFETMTSEGGMFFQGMEKQSMTFSGMISTMKDNLSLMLADVGAKILPAAKELVGALSEIISGPLADLAAEIIKSFTPLIEMVIGILGPVMEALVPVFGAFAEVLKPVIQIIQIILVPILRIISPLFGTLARILMLVANILVTLMPILEPVLLLILAILEGLIMGLLWVINLFVDVVDWIRIVIDTIITGFTELWSWAKGLFGFDDEGNKSKEVKLKIDTPSSSQMLQSGIPASMKNTNINISNTIPISMSGDPSSRAGAQASMEAAARAVFTIELQKIIMDAGL